MSENNPITSSSDAWATLIVNIAPLLVLVGEKHVKGYFKIISKQSHLILFAAGPIGLVTAVTTLVRLKGSTTLRRLIGRLFETKAEIFADVTGVSAGDVQLELKNGTLEQSTEPNEEDIALFFINGGFSGSVAAAKEYWGRVYGLCMSLSYATVMSMELQYDTVRHSVLGGSVRSRGANSREVVLEAARGAERVADILDNLEETEGTDAAVFAFGSFSDMSLSLTLNECLDGKLADVARISVAVFCLLANAGLIFANWYVQREMQATLFMAIGAAVSALGSYYIARIVNDMSVRRLYSLEGLNLSRSGFLSRRIRNGITLSFTPTHVVTSEARPWGHATQKKFDYFAHGVIGFMSIGYVVLYLGLRTSEWWVCFCMLGISVLASVTRAVIVPDSFKAIDTTDKHLNESLPNPFIQPLEGPPPGGFGFRKVRRVTQDIDLTPTSSPSAPQKSNISSEKKAELSREISTDSTEVVSPENAPIISRSSQYHELVFSWITTGSAPPGNRPVPLPITAEIESYFCGSIFLTVLKLRERGLQPIEVSSNTHKFGSLYGRRASFGAIALDSHWLRPDGIIQQPLSVIVQPPEIFVSNPIYCYDFLVPFNLWFWRAQSKEQTDDILDWEDKSLWATEKNICPTKTTNEFSRASWDRAPNPTTLWMAVKIAFILYADWSDQRIRMKYYDEIENSMEESEEEEMGIFRERHREQMVNGLLEAGLLVPVAEEMKEIGKSE